LLSGIETTTGLLGQGIANAVGMAISSKKNGDKNKIYCTVGDGCLMEGISYEAMSLAGHLKLNNLVVIFDDNSVTIDGNLDLSFSENHEQRFLSQNWSVIKIDGHNIDEIRNAFESVKNIEKPTIIIAKTIIGYGSKYQNTNMAHGSLIDK
jgi:transketolase